MDAWTLNRERNNATIVVATFVVIIVRCCTGLELMIDCLVSCTIVNVSCNKCCNLTWLIFGFEVLNFDNKNSMSNGVVLIKLEW